MIEAQAAFERLIEASRQGTVITDHNTHDLAMGHLRLTFYLHERLEKLDDYARLNKSRIESLQNEIAELKKGCDETDPLPAGEISTIYELGAHRCCWPISADGTCSAWPSGLQRASAGRKSPRPSEGIRGGG